MLGFFEAERPQYAARLPAGACRTAFPGSDEQLTHFRAKSLRSPGWQEASRFSGNTALNQATVEGSAAV